MFNVTYFGAQAYCRDAGKELPTMAEWQAAARPPGKAKYPWGDGFENPAALCGNRFAAAGRALPTRPVGRFGATDRSEVGCLDVAGNVAEWCADHDAAKGNRAVCGGSYADAAAEAFDVGRPPRWVPQVQHDRTVGFRGVVRVRVTL